MNEMNNTFLSEENKKNINNILLANLQDFVFYENYKGYSYLVKINSITALGVFGDLSAIPILDDIIKYDTTIRPLYGAKLDIKTEAGKSIENIKARIKQ